MNMPCFDTVRDIPFDRLFVMVLINLLLDILFEAPFVNDVLFPFNGLFDVGMRTG